ncbi:MAG: excinuclease ABC subunit UvrC [Yaniella sp.]|uniref:excinuclease ABC subunit UvrC n=1 Tax=Yaniella sp. TaxID=2773929 RepID=UPI0026499692|nr:excinuclease ABC subunit UvrC [Yaniella sp.]MDN5704503.1 excinuclease ABC subunit UvrC [Yaniella sp.]MDN5731726.1 excinuclease ABC subunit UvrC [Yaniella sp.]MDN5815557.1 excinuclease ABC subunit UvrC [Yaniella sp.]MDN5818147.1 excinuclease ABC subunit UvrC [Yaniella sp.]MDN5838407.1 excinuclease ABC subunit UvrC [Yaniella sp.]
MADPASYRPKTSDIPTDPGVYRFKDPHGRIIYVGKANNVRSRLSSYFVNPNTLPPKTRTMVHTAAAVEWTTVASEQEAIQLEYTWIKEFTPRFNIMYRDDKSYPYLAVTMNEKFPRVMVMRGDRRKGVKYFGPFHPAKAIRETVDRMLRVFPVRTCSAGVFRRAQLADRPCLMGYIDKCAAPCVNRISEEDHYALAEDFVAFMNGDVRPYLRELEQQMQTAVADLRYEDAARYRDDIEALKKVFERNAVVLPETTEADIFAFAEDELEAAFQVFHVRDGRIRGQRGWVVEKVEDTTEPQLVEQLLLQIYGDMEDTERIPREVLVPVLPANPKQIETWMAERRGAKVNLRVPQRGTKSQLLETVQENANGALRLHKSRRSGDITARSAALRELQEALEFDQPLLRIEAYDISHVQGTNVVGSMVVFEDGLPKKRDYRKFNVTGDAARDDTAAMDDVLSRRFKNFLKEQAEAPEMHSGELSSDEDDREEPKRFSYPPSLVVVDGGLAQVNAAQQALLNLGIDDVPVVGLAKRLEELWIPGDDFPMIMPRSSQGLYLLQRLRDESHRFAIQAHRSKRSSSMIQSVLDEVPGLGEKRRKELLKHFGSLKKVRQASIEDLQVVSGVGPKLAQAIYDTLTNQSASKEQGKLQS